MARTIIDIPTALSDQEIGAKLAIFLLNNGFKKVTFRGEELYRIGALLMRPGYLKVLYGNGMVHVEAFYVGRWGDSDIDSYFDPQNLRKKLLPLVMEIGANQVGDELQHAMQRKAPDSYQPEPNLEPHGYDDPDAEERREKKKKRRKKGCLVALIIFFALLGGCVALVMLYPSPEDSGEVAADSSVADIGLSGAELS